jgi:hypothetical protein
MQKHHGGLLDIEHIRQAAGVIEMSVTQHHGVGCLKGDVEAASVVLQNISLTCIEQDPVSAVLDPERQPVFGQETLSSGRVLGEHRDS